MKGSMEKKNNFFSIQKESTKLIESENNSDKFPDKLLDNNDYIKEMLKEGQCPKESMDSDQCPKELLDKEIFDNASIEDGHENDFVYNRQCSEEFSDGSQCSEEFSGSGQCPDDLLDNGQEIKEIIRSSMHWEEFFGSSLELAPALLSIYDSIAARTIGENKCMVKNRNHVTINQSEHKQVGQNERVDNLCKMASTSSVSVDQDCKKRPLSISSMSSSSSSSLPRHIHKRPNLSLCDVTADAKNESFGDKLDHLMYIDDDVPNGTTDEEMSFDADISSKSSAEILDINCNSESNLSELSYSTPSRSAQTSLQDSPQKYISYVHRVVTEIVETERTYIGNLKDILEGYLGFIKNSPHLRISAEDISSLFGNIEEIYNFGREILLQLEKCDVDPIQVAECFVRNNEGFKIYAQYCTNYPSAVGVLTKIMKDPVLSEEFKREQLSLSHNLPLGAYLLKPVQRILKYHLLLQNILKHYSDKDDGYDTLTQALDHMTSMAHHINEMKRKHEHAVRVQEIQSQLEDYQGEDLTRLGELVLEGSFRIYGAKTSRQVFLFEKGVLVGKRKEDGMLICRVFIECSNLMLVESIPKEPLSFQVIPFDNPKGQHTLQARNLDQKRKWCQEIKRLIIESFKGKIPEKVKGLVMQLGKSREEDSAKSTLEPRKIYHHNAPEYLEKRQRMRRKSGTLLTDLLKPQRARKGQRRAESVSPRSSPPQERKILSQSPLTPDTRALYNSSMDSTISINTPPTSEKPVSKAVSRSVSFRQAINRKPLKSVDFGSIENKENTSKQNTETPPNSRRSKSFKRATKLNPLLSVSMDELASDISQTPKMYSPVKIPTKSELELSSEQSSPKMKDKFHRSDRQSNSSNKGDNLGQSNRGSMSRHARYSSMPVLNMLEPSSPSLSRYRKCSHDFGGQDQASSVAKRIFDTKLYFQRNKTEDQSETNNFRRSSNSVSAFNDSFIRKSTENLSQKMGPITLTKPRTFTSSLSVKPKKHEVKKSFSLSADVNEDPWEPKTMLTVPKNRNRANSAGTENDIDKMDWIVYANRNSLPVKGFELGPKLYNHGSPLQSPFDSSHEHVKSEQSKGETVLNNLINSISKVSHSPLDKSKSDNCLDEEHSDFPNFGALPVVKVTKSQSKLNRSNSNPITRLNKTGPRHSSPALFDHNEVKDHEQIIAEMEDYMKRSESTSTVSSIKFPSNVGHNTAECNENKRDSCLSTFSNSSYESTDTAPNSPVMDNFMGSLKNKISDLKQKLSHRRSGSYDNRDSSDNEFESEKFKPKETRSSLLSLFSNRPKDQTNLQTVLHAGDLGSAMIGQRMAEQEPTYDDITLSLTRQKSNSYKVSVNGQEKFESLDNYLVSKEKLHNCDSAFSIQGDMAYNSITEDSPRSQNSDEKSQRKGSQSSADSYYERQLSDAFDEGFRDSAVYCEMEPETSALKLDLKLPSRVPIKSYVQQLEENSKITEPCVVKVKQREPGAIIKQRLESLHTSSNKSRPSSIERELRFYSRPSSVERELSFPRNRLSSEERQIRSLSLDKELPPLPKTSEIEKPNLRRVISDMSYRYPSSSRYSNDFSERSHYSGDFSPTASSNRIDQLTNEINNLIVMRGWVRQLIDKFQTKP